MQMSIWHGCLFIFIVPSTEGVEALEFRKCRSNKTKQITAQSRGKKNERNEKQIIKKCVESFIYFAYTFLLAPLQERRWACQRGRKGSCGGLD